MTENVPVDGGAAPAAPTTPATPAAQAVPAAPTDPASATAEPAAVADPSAAPAAPEAAQPAPAAPAAHDYSGLRAPEGVTPQALEGAIEFARAEGLAPDVAQKVLDRDHAQLQAEHERLKGSLEAQRDEWKSTLAADPELGGDKLPITRQRVDSFLAKFDTSGELRKTLDAYGYIDNPVFVGVIARAQQAFEPAPVAPGGASAAAPTSPAEILYGPS